MYFLLNSLVAEGISQKNPYLSSFSFIPHLSLPSRNYQINYVYVLKQQTYLCSSGLEVLVGHKVLLFQLIYAS